MRPRDLKRVISALYGTRRAVFVWGPPGVGKSQVIQQAAQTLGVDYMDVRLPYHDPGDLKFPIVNLKEGTMKFIAPLLPKDPHWKGILTLEELPQAPPMVQACAMQLTLDRMIGDTPLSEDTMIVACGNRQEDRAGAHRLLTALSNRFIHYDLDISPEDWQAWALDFGIDSRVRSYLNWKPLELHRFRPELNEREFPTPRSWHFASDALPVTPSDLRLETLSGCIGKSAAAEFIGYLEIAEAMEKKYAMEQILHDPVKAPVPTLGDGSVLWALSGALAEKCRDKHKPTVHAAMQYAMRLPLEFATYALRSIVKLGGSMNALTAPGADAFLTKHKHIILSAA